MGRNIDELADARSTQYKDPRDRFEETFLTSYYTSQWPIFIDETAIDLSSGIAIGDTQLDRNNFAREVGPLYKQGMISAAGGAGDVVATMDGTVNATDLGTIVYQLNRLSYQVERSDTGLKNVQHAVEAVIEKLLLKDQGLDLPRRSHHDTGAIADIIMELFSDEAVARQASHLVNEFENSVKHGLLARLDEPQMMTPLWNHQYDALERWQEAEYRGYADMATATGKTVLGLAAIALRYGGLHPTDELSGRTSSSSRDNILIVAHSDLILEQWRREFDRHLNIPEERTQGADDIELTWGNIHFRTPQRLINQSRHSYDLVILDEAHHYATDSGWGELLNHFDGDVLALSGSVNDAGSDSDALRDRLKATVGPEVKRYTIPEAQTDGVIPAFDWEVRYAPMESDNEFAELSRATAKDFEEFQQRVDDGAFETDRRLRTFDDVRNFSHTTTGKELKRSDTAFRKLSTGLFSRRMKRWHQSPSVDAIVEVVADHSNDHVIVLVDSNAQVRALTERLEQLLPTSVVLAATSDQSRIELRDCLDEFNDSESGGVVVGTGDLLGEGIDIPQANVAINMATGGVNAQLVQRIGRILRNPTGDKHAHFYNVVALPNSDALVPAEDGRRLLEEASEFCALGDRFKNLPGFALASDLDCAVASELLTSGAESIQSLRERSVYDLPADPVESEHLLQLLNEIWEAEAVDADTILGEWSEYNWYETAQGSEYNSRDIASITVAVLTSDNQPLENTSLSVRSDRDTQVTVPEGARGEWAITAPIGDSITIEATHPDFDPAVTTITVEPNLPTVELALPPTEYPAGLALTTGSQDTSRCEFAVLDTEHAPVPNAAISISGAAATGFATTDCNGSVTFSRNEFVGPVQIAIRHVDSGVAAYEIELPTYADLEIALSNP